jgi:hypothetical protein
MSFDFGFGKSKSKTKSSSQSDPWDVATPYITDFLSKQVSPAVNASTSMTPAQSKAFRALKANAGAAVPYAEGADDLAMDLFGTKSRAPQVEQAYSDFSSRTTPVATGQNLDLENNPYISAMLAKSAGDAMTGVNEMFAGSGRSFSGAHMGEIGRAVTEAQLPTLANLYQYEQGRTDAANRDLMTQGSSAATTEANLDQVAANLRSMGIDVGKGAIDLKNLGPSQILEIEQQMKMLPYDQMERLASILFPAGQLGQQQQGTSSTKGTNIGAKAGVKLF